MAHLCKLPEEQGCESACWQCSRAETSKPTTRQRKGEGSKSAEVISLTSTDDANGKEGATHKARGADNRKRLTIREKAEALELSNTTKGTTVAQKFGIGESTLYAMKKEHEQIKEKGTMAKPGMKSAKDTQFAEVR